MANDVLLRGGPRDGGVLHDHEPPVAEVEIDGLMHRYVLTNQRDAETSYTVYNYDGVIDPSGATPGAETPDGGHHAPVEVDEA